MISATTPWPYPTLFAHRGGGSLAPENTLAAIKMGLSHQFTAVEFDVKLSFDHIAHLMHDDTLERTTTGTGPVATQSMAALEKLDAGAWHSAGFIGERIPRFSAVMQYLRNHATCANVEIKPCPQRERETGEAIAGWCSEFSRASVVKPLLSSFSLDALLAARAVSADLPIGFLVETPEQSHLAALAKLNAVSLHCHHATLTRERVDFFHQHGYRVMTYTVNDKARVAELIAMKVDGIFTDNLAVMAKKFGGALANGGKKPLLSA